MPPLAIPDMSERAHTPEVDVEKQAVGKNHSDSIRGVPTFVLTVPHENVGRSSSRLTAKNEGNFLPLPASRYRYTKWHDIQNMEVKGNMLRSPRIRRAPKGYNVSTIYAMEKQDEEEEEVARSRDRWKNRKRLNYQSKLECWETCEAVNLSYQELGDPYQVKQFLVVLQKLIRCESLQLMDNGLKDLASIYLPRCKYLYLQRNFLSNLKKLPKAPMLEHLSLQHNNIVSLEGITSLRRTKIVSLTLRDNPIELEPCYRKRVFKLLPSLKILDDIPKLEEDSTPITEESTCSVS